MQHTFLQLNKRLLAWIWVLTLVMGPLTYVLLLSFMSRGPYGEVIHHLSFQAFEKISEPGIRGIVFLSFLRSVMMATLTTVLTFALGLPLALFLIFQSGRMKQLLIFFLIIPFWTQFLIRVYAWMSLLSESGILSRFFGITWLFTYKAIFIGMLYNYLPYMTMSLFVSLEKLDPLILDAASDLGASNFKKLTKIILPLARPGIVAGTIMVFIPALGEFVIPDILGGAKHNFIGNLLAQQFLGSRNWPFGAVLSLILILSVLGSYYLLSRGDRSSRTEDLL